MVKHVGKRGDSLIEVMLAVGIFSMVAVAVVAVMSGGTSSSQTALETTLAREEIDSQAEAIRFIHRSYIADKNTGESSAFGQLWQQITAKAVNAENDITDLTTITQFHPSTCDELYRTDDDDLGEAQEYGFIIDPTQFQDYEKSDSLRDAIFIEGDITSNKLQPAATYPHLIYAKTGATDTSTNSTDLLDHNADATSSKEDSELYRAEGIYVIAVKDPDSTSIGGESQSAYYDFYIRTCWYGAGDQAPSTISTVIRLYNPDIAQ